MSEEGRQRREPVERDRGREGGDQRREGSSGSGSPNLTSAVAAARESFQSLAGRRIEAVSSMSREDGGWRFGFEVVELARVPDSTSLLATYEVVVDGDGNLVEYDRVRRYYRNRADEEV